jgi:hypothetical protein
MFRVDSLVGGLSVCRAMESQLHADRAKGIRRIVVLLDAESADPMERLEAPSLTAAEVAAELSLPARAARALVAECLALTEPMTTLAVRSRAAREHRRVEIDPCDDGMCCLTAYLPLADGAMIDTRLQAIARAQPAGDPRTAA